ncbi:MAG: arginine--tRNA ligase [Ilumatobacter sp.]|nr:arginine--tRNA ligase [Ilumatobacter sp.]
MADPLHTIAATLRQAFADVTGLPADTIDPVVRPSDRADAQVNGALALAKQLGRNPRELAAEVVGTGVLDPVCSAAEVAGPGFVNLTFRPEFLAAQLAAAAADERLGVRPAEHPERVVVDYSAPNVAKEMHVGHLRSTVIGDSIVRLLAYMGHTVIRENHIGDWGTPFGMLIEHYLDLQAESGTAPALDMANPNPFYQAARAKFDADDDFKARARERVVRLQSFDPETIDLWQRLVAASSDYFSRVYREMGVLLTSDDVMGESAYHEAMPAVLDRLGEAGLMEVSDGADVVFPPGFTNREGQPLPLIVQKAGGGFNYATSDLACVIDRIERLHATLLVYVVGSPQAQHLAMVFKVAEMAGWLAPPARAVHVQFGSVLGPDRKMFKTRSGESVRLQDLLTEGVERATAAVREKNPDLTPDEQAAIGHAVGMGAIKYADLSSDRVKDYIFDWDRMLAFDGNTAPYLQYAHARICSIFRRAGTERADAREAPITVAEPQERALALALLGFDAAVQDTVDKFSPHRLCTYLFDLAQAFTSFYEACPVLKDGHEATRASRLALCDLTARTLSNGLGLLGIDAPERM